MNIYAIVKNGVVVNTIEYATEPTTPPAGFEDGHIAIQASGVSIGWTYLNGQFTDPNPPIVSEIVTSTSPTKEELLAQLNALSAQIQAFA